MSFTDFLIVNSPVVSGLIWFVVLVSFLYMAREPAHFALRSLSRVLHSAFRLSSKGGRSVTIPFVRFC